MLVKHLRPFIILMALCGLMAPGASTAQNGRNSAKPDAVKPYAAKYEGLLNEAAKLVTSLQYTEAQKVYAKALVLAPADERAWIKSIECSLLQGNLAQANETRSKAFAAVHHPHSLYPTSCGIRVLLHNYKAAMQDIKTYQRIAPSDENVWLTIAVIDEQIGKVDESLIAIDRFIKHAPDCALGYEQKANTLINLSRGKEALVCIDIASRRLHSLTDRLDVDRLMAEAECALVQPDNKLKAWQFYQQACIKPAFNFADAERIARLLDHTAPPQTSLEYLRASAKRFPTITMLTLLAASNAHNGNKAAAIEALAELKKIAPPSVHADIEAQTMLELQDFNKAAQAAKLALKLGTDPDGHLHKILVMALRKCGNSNEASVVLQAGVQRAPNDVSLLESACNELVANDHIEQCRKLIQNYRMLVKPTDSSADLLEAKMLMKADLYREALSILNRILVRTPTNTEALVQRGRLYKGLLLDDLAIADFSNAIAHGGPRKTLCALRSDCYARSGRSAEARKDSFDLQKL